MKQLKVFKRLSALALAAALTFTVAPAITAEAATLSGNDGTIDIVTNTDSEDGFSYTENIPFTIVENLPDSVSIDGSWCSISDYKVPVDWYSYDETIDDWVYSETVQPGIYCWAGFWGNSNGVALPSALTATVSIGSYSGTVTLNYVDNGEGYFNYYANRAALSTVTAASTASSSAATDGNLFKVFSGNALATGSLYASKAQQLEPVSGSVSHVWGITDEYALASLANEANNAFLTVAGINVDGVSGVDLTKTYGMDLAGSGSASLTFKVDEATTADSPVSAIVSVYDNGAWTRSFVDVSASGTVSAKIALDESTPVYISVIKGANAKTVSAAAAKIWK